MYVENLISSNQVLQHLGSSPLSQQKQQELSSNHPITSSEAMIKEYCKKEMLEIQRSSYDPAPKQQTPQYSILQTPTNPTNNNNNNNSINGSTNNLQNNVSTSNQIETLQPSLNPNILGEFNFANLEQFAKFNDDDGDNNQKGNSTNNKDSNNGNQGRWTKEEHLRFVEGLSLYGKNWKKVEEHVGSRTGAQIRSHAQKFFNKLERDYNKKHGLLISLNTTSSTKQVNNENINTLSQVSGNLSLKKAASCIVPQQNNHQNPTKILGEKNQNSTKNILNNIQLQQHTSQQSQFEQNFLFGQAIEASLQAAQQSVHNSHSQQTSQSSQNSLLKKALLTSANAGVSSTASIQQSHPILSKSVSQGNSYLHNQQATQQMNPNSFEIPSLLPSLSLRNRSDSVASNFTMMSDEENTKLTDEDLKKIKESLPQMVNSQNLNECIAHYTQLTLNLQKQLLQSNNVQKNLQIQQQINTLQSAVQFLHAYSSMNKTPSSDVSNNENIPLMLHQNITNKGSSIKLKGENSMQIQTNTAFTTNQQSNKENDLSSESHFNRKQNCVNENSKKQQPKQQQILNAVLNNNNTVQPIQLQQPSQQESDHPTDYESFFHFILKRYGKIFDQPQNNQCLTSCQPRLNQFINFEGDYNNSRSNPTNNLFNSVQSSPCNNASPFTSQGSSLKNSTEIGSSSGFPNVLLRARKSSFTLYDNEDDSKVQKLNLLRKRVCTEKENNRSHVIVHPSPIIPKTDSLNQKQNSIFSTILQPQTLKNAVTSTCGNEIYSTLIKGNQQQQQQQQQSSVPGSSLLEIQNLLDEHHIGTEDLSQQHEQVRKDSIPMKSRFSFSDNNSQVPLLDSEVAIDEEIDQEVNNHSGLALQEENNNMNVENEAIEEQQRKLLEAYQKLQQLLVIKNSQNITQTKQPVVSNVSSEIIKQNQLGNKQVNTYESCNSPPTQQNGGDCFEGKLDSSEDQCKKQSTPQFNTNLEFSKQQFNQEKQSQQQQQSPTTIGFDPLITFCNNVLENQDKVVLQEKNELDHNSSSSQVVEVDDDEVQDNDEEEEQEEIQEEEDNE